MDHKVLLSVKYEWDHDKIFGEDTVWNLTPLESLLWSFRPTRGSYQTKNTTQYIDTVLARILWA